VHMSSVWSSFICPLMHSQDI